MRILRFIVENQIIRQDPKCDFSGLIPGTDGYLQAEFSFSPEWSNTVRVAAFHSNLGKEFEPQKLIDGKICMIPADALKNSIFKVSVLGTKTGLKLKTNKVEVRQEGGKL